MQKELKPCPTGDCVSRFDKRDREKEKRRVKNWGR